MRIRCGERKPHSASVLINGANVGDIKFGSRELETISADIPHSVSIREINVVEVTGGDGAWSVEEIRFQNYYGFASGLFNLVVIPGAARAYNRLSWLGIAALFCVLFFLSAIRVSVPKALWIDRVDRLLKVLAALLLTAAAALPFATKYRLLFSSNRLWLFVILLNFAVTAAALKAFFRWVRTGFDDRALALNPRKTRLASLLIPAVIFLFFMSCMFGILRHFDGNYSRFLRIEEKRLEAFAPLYFPADRAAGLRAGLAPLDGYDGEFNYFMAFDPFLSKYKNDPATYGLFIDEPAYRFGRIGFPLLVKLFSLNRPEFYTRTIVWIIVLSHLFGAFFLLKIILFFKKNPFWTFLYILVPGFYYSLQWGLGESIGTALVLAGLYAYLKERIPWTIALMAASLFIRESGLPVILAVIAFEIFRRRGLKRALLLGCSVVPYLLWKGFLTYRLFALNGWETFTRGPADFAVPFSGFLDLFRRIASGAYDRAFVPPAVYYAVLLIVLFALSVFLFIKKRNVWSLVLLLYSMLSISLNFEMVWIGIGGAVRLTTEAFVFLIPAYLIQKDSFGRAWKYVFAAFFAALFVFDFFVMDVSGYFRNAFLIW